MALSTYSELQTAISDWLDRDDLSSFVTDFITLAESMHKRDIRIQEMIKRESITIDSRQISLPSGYLEAINLRILTDPVTVLTYRNMHELNRVREESNDKPIYYTIHEEIEFEVNPDSSYSGEIVFYKEITALSDQNTSNAILSKAPDAYLYGALLQSAPFLMNDERIQVWAELYKQAVQGLNNIRSQNRHTGPLIARPAGATP